MLFRNIPKKVVDLVLFAYLNGYVTSRNQNIVKGAMFYLTIWDLRDKGIIRYAGFVNGRKAWELTEKGREFAEILYILRKKGFV